MFHRFALRTKGRPTQTRSAFVGPAMVKAAVTGRRGIAALALAGGSHGTTVALSVATWSAIGARWLGRLGLARSGPVIAAHRNHGLGRGHRR
jgi:hypothetical protein